MQRGINNKLLSETENAKTERAELLSEIRRVTNLEMDDVVKILEIQYLVKHYFSVREDENFQ